MEGHEFKTPEEELLHFLKKLYDPNWKWAQQYEPEPMYDHDDIKDKNERWYIHKTLWNYIS